MSFLYTLTYKSEREMGEEERGREGESRSLQTDAGSQGFVYALPQICCVIHPNVFKCSEPQFLCLPWYMLGAPLVMPGRGKEAYMGFIAI